MARWYRVLVGKSEGKRILGIGKAVSGGIVRMDRQELGRGAWTGSICIRIGTGAEQLKIRE
jgi:hypothetical protein